MSADGRPDPDATTDPAGASRLPITIIAVCVAVMLFDGFDTQAISFAAPAIAHAWHVSPSGFGFVFGIGLFGGLVGAICSGVVADRIGRKPTLTLGVLVFGVVTLLTPLADSMDTLSVIRFATGLGLGGALPGAIAIATESAPTRMRATVAAVTFCGIPLGSVIASVLASQLIPGNGWTIIFIIGGVPPLMLLPFIVLWVPESLAGGERAERARRVPLWSLFTEGRALGTVLLSLALFFTLLMAFFLVNWIPTLATRAGIGTQAAILGVGALNVGGVLGALTISRLARRLAPGMLVSVCYVLGAVAIAAVGQTGTSGPLLLVTTFVAGFLAIGAQMCTVSLTAIYYDTRLRATGVGWTMGCGRVGGIIGPTVGGWLVAASFSMGEIFAIAGLVCAACALTVFVLGRFVLAAPRPAPLSSLAPSRAQPAP